MPGLELIGNIAATVRVPSPNEAEQGYEDCGIFIAGDARDVAQYSGMDLGTRWLCRLQGPGCEIVRDWPTPDHETWRYHATEEAARLMFEQLRGHIRVRFPGVQVVDGRDEIPLNVPTCIAERYYQNGTEVLRLFYDRMTDLQVAVRNTNLIRRFDAHPAAPKGPGLVSYSTQSDVMYLAIARGASGAAQHVCIVYAPEHKPQEVIAAGMPRAATPLTNRLTPIVCHSGFLIAFWGRANGASIVAPARGQDPAAMLHAYLGQNVAAPLQTNVPGLDARLPTPAAWAIRVEPGEYEPKYLELDADAGKGYSLLWLCKTDAPSFQPFVPGNAGGMKIDGRTLEEYAMIVAERERILMSGGDTGAGLAMLCQKWGLPVPRNAFGVDIGYAGRILEWEKAIQSHPSMNAQFVAQKGVAGFRLQGIEPTPEMLAQMKAQQIATTEHLAQAEEANKNARNELAEGAPKIIELARRMEPAQLVEEAKKLFQNEMRTSGTPAYGFYKALQMLKQPGYQGNPRFIQVDQVTEKLAKAHYACMKPEDQRQEGSEKKYVKETIAEVYEPNGLPVPGVGGFFSRLVDKM